MKQQFSKKQHKNFIKTLAAALIIISILGIIFLISEWSRPGTIDKAGSKLFVQSEPEDKIQRVKIQGDWLALFPVDQEQANINVSQVQSIRLNFQADGTVFYEIAVHQYTNMVYSTPEGNFTEKGRSMIKPGRSGTYKVYRDRVKVVFNFQPNDRIYLGPFIVEGKKLFRNEPKVLVFKFGFKDGHLFNVGHDAVPTITFAKNEGYQNTVRFTNPVYLKDILPAKEQKLLGQQHFWGK